MGVGIENDCEMRRNKYSQKLICS